MIKNPWKKDGRVHYFELIKIAVITLSLTMVFSLYLETTLTMSQVSTITSAIVLTLLLIQFVFINYEIYQWIVSVLSITMIETLHLTRLPMKRILVFVQRCLYICPRNGLIPMLKYRVMRI